MARWTNKDGQRKSAGTFRLERDAQAAIDAAYERESTTPTRTDTLGGYAALWPKIHPRSERTNYENKWRVGVVLNIEVEGVELRHWTLNDIRRRHALAVQAKLLEQGRSAEGATGILRVMSAMTNDAIDDEVCDANPWLRLGVRATDPRVKKPKRPVRVWSWEDMHTFAAATGAYQPAVRVLSDCGLRLGELLPLHRADLSDGLLRVERTSHDGVVLAGTKTTHDTGEGRDVPVPPTLAAMLAAMPPRIDTPLLFPTPTGKLWWEKRFYRVVWQPAQKATGMDIRPHEMRHSFVSLMRAAGVDPADLAEITGHTVATMHGRYTHPLRRSFDHVREAVG
jgi:integrase